MKFSKKVAFFLALVLMFSSTMVFATDFTNGTFIVRDPVLTNGGASSSNGTFSNDGVIGQSANGSGSNGTFINNAGYGYFNPPTLIQNTYRWYDNVDSVQPTTALSTENSSYANASYGVPLRLRIALKAKGDPLPPNSYTFKLQFAQQTNGAACSSLTYTDIGVPGSAASVWRGYDNPSVADGAQVGAILLSSSSSRETYEESNDTAVSPALIYGGANLDGEWDWSLFYNGANNLSYCFRMVNASGTALDTYNVYPLVTIGGGSGGGGGGGGGSGSGSGSSGSTPSVSGQDGGVAPTLHFSHSPVRHGYPVVISGQTSAHANVTITYNNSAVQVTADDSGAYTHRFYTDTLIRDTYPVTVQANGGPTVSGEFIVGDTSTPAFTYEEEQFIVKEQGIVTKDFTNSATKCEFMMMLSRIAAWPLDSRTKSTHFTDINDVGVDWCAAVADYGYDHGIIEGRSPGVFGVTGTINRYEVAVIIARQLGAALDDKQVTSFVDDSEIVGWARGAVAYLQQQNIFKGFTLENGTSQFGGDTSILKQDAAIVLFRTYVQ